MATAAAPYFSIVVPVYNRALLLGETIASVLNQTYEDFELIVVDDGSTDSPETTLQPWADPRISFYRTENRERGAARNTGTQKARGRYVIFFDSDDKLYPDHLENGYAFAKQTDEPEFFHTGYDILDEKGNRIAAERFARSTDRTGKNLMDRLIITNFLGCDSVFLRRDIALLHPFNEDRRLASSEDWELWLRLASRYPLLSSDAVTFAMIHHSGRSLLTISADSVLERDKLLMEYLFKDRPFREKFTKNLKSFRADRFTFFALMLSLTPNRKMDALRNLMQSLTIHPSVLIRKRFWATLRIIVRGASRPDTGV